MTTRNIQTATAPSEPLPDMPIEPTSIKEGNPTARGTIAHQSADKKVSSGFWTCTEGKFEWTFAWDEFVHVLQGSATITEDGPAGRSHTLTAGDTAHFPIGLKTHWHVTAAVKKFFVVRTPEPLEL